VTSIPSQSGSGFQAVFSIQDITDLTRRLDESRRTAAELANELRQRAALQNDLCKAKDAADAANRAKSDFLANMSHEIRTPMNGILGFADLLKEPHLTDELQQQYISIIEKSGKRMLNIINDIVSISKIESGQMKVSMEETNVNQQIEFIYSFFRAESEKKGLQLLVKNMLPFKECLIKTDREKLFAILTNLVGNALKYTHQGSIQFGVEKKCDYLEFFVKDTGIGISEDYIEKIFLPFSQEESGYSRKYEGNGLGLALVKNYLKLINADIRVESEKGIGSNFIVNFN